MDCLCYFDNLYCHRQYRWFYFYSGNIYFFKKLLVLELCDSDFEVTCLSLLTTREAIRNIDEQLKGLSWTSVTFEIQLSAKFHCLKLIMHLIRFETMCCCIKHCLLVFGFGMISEHKWNNGSATESSSCKQTPLHAAHENIPVALSGTPYKTRWGLGNCNLKHFMKGSSCIFCLILHPGLQEVFLLRNMLLVAFLHIWQTMRWIFCCKYVLDWHLLVWFS